MLNRVGRWLTWGLVVVLQAMAPFVHVHAASTPADWAYTDALHTGHAGFLHVHLAAVDGHGFADVPHAPALTVGEGILPRALADVPPPALPARLHPAWADEPMPSLPGLRAATRVAPPNLPVPRLPPALAPPFL